jgi:arylsulfatase
MPSRRDFLRAGAAAAAGPLLWAQRRRPNFLIILADDMGFSDAGCYGGEVETVLLQTRFELIC